MEDTDVVFEHEYKTRVFISEKTLCIWQDDGSDDGQSIELSESQALRLLTVLPAFLEKLRNV